MNYQEEVIKRLLKIKEISKRAAEDKDLKNFTGIHHPAGTTKISKTNRNGIVDKNLR